jgi:hypothetical protein
MNKQNLKFINDNQLASFMNKTRWRELADELTSNDDFEPKVRLKYLRQENMTGFTLLDWEWVRSGESSCIEWMDIDPIKRVRQGQLVKDKEYDFRMYVESTLKELHIKYTIEDEMYRVWGYSNSQPDFVQ